VRTPIDSHTGLYIESVEEPLMSRTTSVSLRTQLWGLVIVMAIIFSVLLLGAFYLAQRNAHEGTELAVVRSLTELESMQRNIERTLKKEASVLAGLPGLIALYELADEDLARLELRELVKPTLESMARFEGVDPKAIRVHFHKKPSKSFLRPWRPIGQKDGGDDLSHLRKSILQATTTGKSVSGLEVGRGGVVARGLAPVIAPDGTVLGSIEVYISLKKLFQQAQEYQEAQYAMFLLEDIQKKAKMLKSGDANPQIGDFVLQESTEASIISHVSEQELQRGIEEVDFSSD
jgi:uncharacterized membrane protein (UPF0136 family)